MKKLQKGAMAGGMDEDFDDSVSRDIGKWRRSSQIGDTSGQGLVSKPYMPATSLVPAM